MTLREEIDGYFRIVDNCPIEDGQHYNVEEWFCKACFLNDVEALILREKRAAAVEAVPVIIKALMDGGHVDFVGPHSNDQVAAKALALKIHLALFPS